jgi:major vault protein
MTDNSVIRIKPYSYIHVLDNNTNVTRVEVGPQTFTRQDHEKVVAGPESMVIVPPRNYCIISNPVMRDEKAKIVTDPNGQVKYRHGDEEIRFEQDPFALFPGEKLTGKVTPLQVVTPNTALKVKCIRDFTDEKKNVKKAGDEWLFEVGTYIPRIEVTVLEIVKAVIIRPDQALKLRARKAFVDKSGKERKAGEEYLYKVSGAYIPSVDEEVLDTLTAYILTPQRALHLRATRTYTDVFKKPRKAGEEWIVTYKDTETYIIDIFEQLVGEVKITTLNNRQYTVVLDPWRDGRQVLGQKELRKGEVAFFLQPGE